MYREQGWFDAFEFSYDMSVPNAAHLEPQRGGCCTVMPYFVGRHPGAAVDDDPGLLAVSHPGRVFHRALEAAGRDPPRKKWSGQLHHASRLPGRGAGTRGVQRAAWILSQLRSERNVWIALPGEVNDWWRDRRRMTLVRNGSTWCIEGPGSDRARIAYASLDGDSVTYRVAEPSI